jgi:hypothetical protein
MITRFSVINPKMLQMLQGIDTYKSAHRQHRTIIDSIGVPKLLICHLAKYLQLPEAEIIEGLLPKKK